jgi:hypothetical protein
MLNIFCLPRTPVQDMMIQNSIQSIITDFRIYFACCRNNVTTEFGLEVASLYFWHWNCISKHRMREISKLLAVHSVPFMLYGKGGPNACLLSSSLMSNGSNWHHLNPRFLIKRRLAIFFFFINILGSELCTKRFQSRTSSTSTKNIFGAYRFTRSAFKRNLSFPTLFIDMFCNIATKYTYYLFKKVLTDWSV